MSLLLNGKIAQQIGIVAGAYDADLSSAVTTAWVSAGDATQIAALVATAAATAADVITVQFKQATSSAGAGAANLGSALTYTVPASGIVATTFERALEGLAATSTHVAATVSCSAAVAGTVTLLKAGKRFAP